MVHKCVGISPYLHASDEYVVPAVFGRVVRAPMAVHTPVAGELGAHALTAVLVTVAVVEAEVGRHEVRSCGHPHRELGLDEVCEGRKREVSEVVA